MTGDEAIALCKELGIENVKCTCGSGGHPRECKRHPWGYELHVADMNAETRLDWMDESIELEEKLAKVESLYKDRELRYRQAIRYYKFKYEKQWKFVAKRLGDVFRYKGIMLDCYELLAKGDIEASKIKMKDYLISSNYVNESRFQDKK